LGDGINPRRIGGNAKQSLKQDRPLRAQPSYPAQAGYPVRRGSCYRRRC